MKATRIAIVIAMISIFSTAAFAQFEITASVPMGVGISLSEKVSNFSEIYPGAKLKSVAGFEWGIHILPGWYFALPVANMGISALLDLGFGQENFDTRTEFSYGGINGSISVKGDGFAFSVGVLPKFNIGAFAIGIGAGAKFMISDKVTMITKIADYKQEMTFKRKEFFKSNISPYIKGTFDYNLYLNDRMAVQFGLYVGYDFGMSMKTQDEYNEAVKSVSAVDIGAQVGFKFGPKPM